MKKKNQIFPLFLVLYLSLHRIIERMTDFNSLEKENKIYVQ